MLKNKQVFLTTDTNNKPKIEYVGIFNVLDILTRKIEESKDIKEIKEYVGIYKSLYLILKGSDKDED